MDVLRKIIFRYSNWSLWSLMNFCNVNYTHELQFLIGIATSRFCGIFTYIRNLVPDCNFVKRWFANNFHDGILWSLKVEIKKRPPLQKQLRRTACNVPLFCQSVKRRRDSYFYSRYNFYFFTAQRCSSRRTNSISTYWGWRRTCQRIGCVLV